MSSETSIGPDDAAAGNENHGNADGCGNKTLGSHVADAPATGAEVLREAGPDLPAGVAGSPAHPGVKRAPEAFPDGPNVEASPWELEAARGKPPKRP